MGNFGLHLDLVFPRQKVIIPAELAHFCHPSIVASLYEEIATIWSWKPMQNGRWNSQLVMSGITLLVFVAGCFAIVFASQSKTAEEAPALRNTSFEVGNHSNEDSSSDDGKLENIPTDFGKPHSLPLPSSMSVPKYEQ